MDIANSPRRKPVKQFSIFSDNKVGRLNELVQRLGSNDVHILALSLLDTTDSTIMRIIVDYPESAKELLEQANYSFSVCDVVAVEFENESQIKYVTSALTEAEINIHYVYPFLMRPSGQSGLVLNLEDPDLAESVLSCRGIKILTQMDIAR